MADYSFATVRLWDHDVGAITESSNGQIAFEYEDSFRGTGLEISPLHLPLERDGTFTFPELQRLKAFAGLPGVFADALPDRFGNELIKRYFEGKGRPAAVLSPVQKLLYVGDRAMGALSFQPGIELTAGTEEAIEVRLLVDQARSVIEGNTDIAIPEIMQVGSTVGGARAKALINWNRETDIVRSGYATPLQGDEQWIIKFDGVSRDSGGLGMHADREPQPWGRIEYVYSQMARDAGIDMAETHLLADGDLAHFMTRRFDRTHTGPIHMHTLGGVQHVDYNDQYVFSYEAYFDTIRALGLGQPAIDQAFRRMVFAVATINFDDHLKNFSFLMDRKGSWSLAPAYDVMYAENKEWTRQHQMSINGKFDGITRTDLGEVARQFDIPRGGDELTDEVVGALEGWSEYSRVAGVPKTFVEYLQRRFERV